jgi:hypothetical protein
VTTRQLTFTRIQDTTADDWAIIATRPDTKLFEELPDRLLGALRFLENVDFYTVNGLEHSLQAGTRALRHGRPAEYVVAALLHDVGDLVGPRNHAAVAASILRPYVSERIAWIVEHHTVFQFNHFGHHTASTPTCATLTSAIPTTKTRPSSSTSTTQRASIRRTNHCRSRSSNLCCVK